MKEIRPIQKNWALMIVGVITFGILMGIRPEFETVWARTAIAGCAGAALAIILIAARNSRSQ